MNERSGSHKANDPEFGFLSGGGEVGDLMRARNWTASPLGIPSRWEPSLKTTVGLLLSSHFPMFVAWGPDLGFLYNDAYARILGTKHPAALGERFADIWSEIWAEILPFVDNALAGRATWIEDLPLVLNRHGYEEETYFTFSYSPVRDDDGQVAGLFCAVTETTDRVFAERRLDFQIRLEDRLRGLADPRAVMSIAAGLLGQHLRVDRSSYAEIDDDDVFFVIEEDWTAADMPSLVGRHRLDDFGPARIAAFRDGRTVAFEDARNDSRMTDRDVASTLEAARIRAALTVPLLKAGRFAAALSVHSREPRRWSWEDAAFVRDVAERTWAAVERARAEARLRRSEGRLRLALEAGRLGSWTLDLTTSTLTASDAFRTIFGRDAGQAFTYEQVRAAIHPDDREWTASRVQQCVAGGEDFEIEYRAIWPNGEMRWVQVRGQPAYAPDGTPLHLTGVAIDVTERKLADDHLHLMIDELNHRMKNFLATVQSIAAQTFRKSVPFDQARAEFSSRLMAVSKAHDVLTETNWTGACLRTIVERTVEPYDGSRHDRFRLDGPHLLLAPKSALSLSMALHELCTNAAKYGALSDEGGRVDIGWTVDDAPAETRLRLRWTESDGPRVAPPKQRGFGSRLIEQGLAAELGGEVRIDFEPAGVICVIDVPLSAA